MKTHIISKKASKQEIQEMLEALESYIKVAVDIEIGILAGGGIMHADCEAMLLENGSRQSEIWGANWDPETNEIQFEALINIRPKQNNRSMEIQDEEIKSKVEAVIRKLLKP